jgi:hypothetical protein
MRPDDPGFAADHVDRRPVLCAHADNAGRGAHWLPPGEKCAADKDMAAEADREAGL